MQRTLTLLAGISCWLAPQLATQAQSLQLLSTFNPSVAQGPADAVATPNRLYVADFSNPALRIYDTSQPTKLVQLGSLTSLIRPRRVVVNGTKAYVSSVAVGTISQGNIYAVDISNSAAPSVIRTATVLPGIAKMAATSTLVCAAINDARNPQVYVYDSNLNLLSAMTIGVDGIALNDKYLYLLSGNAIYTYDLSVPSTPVRVSSVTTGSYTATGFSNPLAFANNYLYVNGHAGIFSVSNPALPALVPANSFTFNKLSGSGTTAYQLSTGSNNVATVVDLRVPTAPKIAATGAGFDGNNLTDTVTGQDDLVYVLSSSGGQAGQIKTYRYTASVLATRGSALPAFTLYPNPATDAVTLKLPTAAAAGQRVALLNVCGQLVREQALPAGSTHATLSLANLSAGVYFVQSGNTIQKLLRQ